MLALPWTVGLLDRAIVITLDHRQPRWAASPATSRTRGCSRRFGIVAIGLQPIPYYIVAFLMVIIFGFLWPVLPISGGFAMNVRPGWTWQFVALGHASMPSCPRLSLVDRRLRQLVPRHAGAGRPTSSPRTM